MSELRAVVVTARMEIFIPFSADLTVMLTREKKLVEQTIQSLPEYARPLAVSAVFKASSHPEVVVFENSLDWDSIRSEFQRKAKRIGLQARQEVSWQPSGTDGFLLWCQAEGRI